jgi:hypothetical protein
LGGAAGDPGDGEELGTGWVYPMFLMGFLRKMKKWYEMVAVLYIFLFLFEH